MITLDMKVSWPVYSASLLAVALLAGLLLL